MSTGKAPPLNLFYMARPPYGGWVSFTAHLALKHSLPLFKVGSKTESGQRPFGYGVSYQNRGISDLPSGRILITAIDKSYYDALDKMPTGSYIVIHDPTEVSGKGKEPVLRNLKRFKVITIRESVKTYLAKEFGINSRFILHPFFEYEFEKERAPSKAVSISRIDFDKHTDIILKANKALGAKAIDIYGAINRQYVFFKLNDLGFKKYYKGGFEKSFEKLSDLLADAKFVVDMSVIKHDGGGSQYTFLEAMYQECALVLNAKWIENQKTPYVHGKNCFVVANEEELADLIARDPPVKKILAGAEDVLAPHIKVNWLREIAKIT